MGEDGSEDLSGPQTPPNRVVLRLRRFKVKGVFGVEDIIKLLQTVGFPVAVAMFLLFKVNKSLERVNAQLNQIVGILRVKDDGKESE